MIMNLNLNNKLLSTDDFSINDLISDTGFNKVSYENFINKIVK